ncbi:MAG TPA: nucleotidyltransferase family protein [Rhodanobacteraceae bacterium]|nr:nucleotidyltransferase family protein [Rhodanobacteraceae bacterium]
MRALVFAAGRGERMRPLTDATPKPLLAAGGKPLLAWHLEKLSAIGVRDVAINVSHLAAQFAATLGDGARWGLRLHYLDEGATALETGGGMLNALPVLGGAPFLAVNGDIWTDFDFARLPREPRGLAHLVLVDNPPQHRQGDFVLRDGAVVDKSPAGTDESSLTFAGIGVYRGDVLRGWQSVIGDAPGAAAVPPRFALAPLLRAAMRHGAVSGEYHAGAWTDAGTPARLAELDARLRAGA